MFVILKALALKAVFDVGYMEKGNKIHVGNKNFIEINGSKYDAVTGKLLSDNVVPKQTTATKIDSTKSVKPKQNVGAVDGFMRKPTSSNSSRSTPKTIAKQPQKSNTLMRKSVNKPKTTVSKNYSAKPTIQKSQLGVSQQRAQAAKETPKSQHVKKYGTASYATSVSKSINPNLTVVQPPKPQHSQSSSNHSPAPQIKATPTHMKASERMINAALANSISHTDDEPKYHSKKKRSKLMKKLGISGKALSLSTSALAVVLLAGFFAVQNVPNLSMRVAATRAGFDASMPNYQPAGFSFKGPIKYSPGQVEISFKSNSDNRSYDVKQQASNWNSDALLANYVVSANRPYQTYLDRGRTLYIYDGSNATWVDDGVWYTIEGQSNMTTDQLIRIAASI